ncbi:hypothetical protein QBC40DRAFT_349454 [Triangularia verruculosa]|uniref:Uncharacterized protein n=1 Tax=Triangularia verruculosa TaxID=2587418 RepID=A0AAN6XEU8_9PEZI|nr:hypothetical protein QBC40DRAFT_349454 [Triangularia verruculosa]
MILAHRNTPMRVVFSALSWGYPPELGCSAQAMAGAEGGVSPRDSHHLIVLGIFFLWVLSVSAFWCGGAGLRQLGKLGRQVWGGLGSRGEEMGSTSCQANQQAVQGDAVMELQSFQICKTKTEEPSYSRLAQMSIQIRSAIRHRPACYPAPWYKTLYVPAVKHLGTGAARSGALNVCRAIPAITADGPEGAEIVGCGMGVEIWALSMEHGRWQMKRWGVRQAKKGKHLPSGVHFDRGLSGLTGGIFRVQAAPSGRHSSTTWLPSDQGRNSQFTALIYEQRWKEQIRTTVEVDCVTCISNSPTCRRLGTSAKPRSLEMHGNFITQRRKLVHNLATSRRSLLAPLVPGYHCRCSPPRSAVWAMPPYHLRVAVQSCLGRYLDRQIANIVKIRLYCGPDWGHPRRLKAPMTSLSLRQVAESPVRHQIGFLLSTEPGVVTIPAVAPFFNGRRTETPHARKIAPTPLRCFHTSDWIAWKLLLGSSLVPNLHPPMTQPSDGPLQELAPKPRSCRELQTWTFIFTYHTEDIHCLLPTAHRISKLYACQNNGTRMRLMA